MIICVDFDGVLADTGGTKRAWISRYCRLELVDLPICRTSVEPLIGSAAYETMQREVGYRDTLSAPPMSNALEIVRRMAQVVSFHLVSARTPEKMYWASRWLEEYEIRCIFEGVHSAYLLAKGTIASRVGAEWLIDNDVRHLRSLPIETRGLLFADASEAESTDISVVKAWNEIEALILGSTASLQGSTS